MDRARLLQPKTADASDLFHWTNWAKAATALKNNKLSQRRWAHFIESENRMIKGTSWSKDPLRWQFAYTVRFRVNSAKLPNKKYEINGDYVYEQTKGMLGQVDPERYKSYAGRAPNETFIEGTIVNFRDLITSVFMDSDYGTNGMEEYFADLMDEFQIPEERRDGSIIQLPNRSLTA